MLRLTALLTDNLREARMPKLRLASRQWRPNFTRVDE